MSQDLYITGAERGSGKSVIALAMMEYFSAQSDRVGFFRPVTHREHMADQLIRLVAQRYNLESDYEAMYGCSHEDARRLIAAGRYAELLKQILDKYRQLQGQYDRVLCVGTDYSYATSALEFDFNTDVANNLGCLVMPVVRGFGRDVKQIREAAEGFKVALRERDCDIFATIINGVGPAHLDALRSQLQGNAEAAPVYMVPEEAMLSKPTLADIALGLDAQILYSTPECMCKEIKRYVVAAMQVPDFLDHIQDDCLVITPGDRADIILSCLMAYSSNSSPRIAGMLLSGGFAPIPQLEKLFSGLGNLPFAILSSAGDTFTTAMKVNEVSAALHADNELKIARALGVVENHVPMSELIQTLASKRSTRVTPLMFEYELVRRAKQQLKHIVLPEGGEERILHAAEILNLRGVVKLTLLGNVETIRQKIERMGLHLEGIDIIDPLLSPLRQQFADTYYKLRQHKGIAPEMAFDAMADVSYFGTMMVYHGLADGMVSGSVHTTQHTIRPSFEIIKTRPGTAIVSSVFFMCLEDKVLVYGDCAVNPNPNAQQLADIAISSAETAALFGVDARVAMLSYSTGSSGKGAAVDKVREATTLARQQRPDIPIEGPIQYDAAVDAGVAKTKLPDSEIAGKATVFIFPDLNTGNNTYKAVQRSSGAVAVGPVLQGLKKPVNDLSRGCTVTDIVNTVAITAIQAQAGSTTP